MFRVALTGGIASGKSAASERFAEHRVPIIDTDQVSREIVQPGQPALLAIAQEFGEDILNADGSLNRQKLRTAVFSDPEKRLALEQLLHPLIRQRSYELADKLPGPYQILVVPLLVESQGAYPCDRVLLIDCDETIQQQRLAARDGSSAQQIQQILAAQSSRAQRQAMADDIILNEGDLETLHQAVDTRHQNYLRMSQS